MPRLPERGLIDRNRTLKFRFDGTQLTGHPGDTLASALLANDVRLVARSFKYHRPRGVVTAGSEEPNALMQIGQGRAVSPNTRATVQELYNGLRAESQNRYPSLAVDFLQVNDFLSSFLSAGFYYKTFMWPKALWEKLYEPAIRKAAGLGALSGKDAEELFDTAYAHCDLLVIGSGPAGLMAALTAGRAGARVILAEEDFVFGGRLLSERLEVGGQSCPEWAAGAVVELDALPNVALMRRTTVTGAYDGGTFGALERVADHMATPPEFCPRNTFWRIAAKRTVLAGGAIERGIAFPWNDRPGVMTAGAVRSYLNRFAVCPGKDAVVFTNNDDGLRTAQDLEDAGAVVRAVVDTRPDAQIGTWGRAFPGGQIVSTSGHLGLTSVTIRDHNGVETTMPADLLAVSGGWNPSVHLTCHMNGRPVWDADISAFVPKVGAVPGLTSAGAAAGRFSTHAALADGADAAIAQLADIGISASPVEVPDAEDAPVAITPFWHVDAPGRAWLDLQNDVTTKDIALAHQENFRSVEHMKRYTTLGMATDQGKMSNVGGLAIMAELSGREIPEVGTTTFRPPYSPVPIAAIAGRHGRDQFQPHRHPPSHALSLERGASFVEAGLWHRAAWYPQPGETRWRQSCDREVAMVRNAVGICDVTTLGKIDIQGPDAADLLDFVYANAFSTLKVGRVRYGLMLREDGFVMDDGTTARLGPQHYIMTTTTAAAGQVMAHLEFVRQCVRPGWEVSVTSVTDQWAQFAVAGPASREVLNELLDLPIDDASMPYMSCGPVRIGGVDGRLFRISFSGEHAYELAVPARYGDALVRELTSQAEARGGGLYGMEALNVMRIEKGFITHAEIHGRTTADDIGMGRMVSAKKDAVGKVLSTRPGLHGPERQQLVGVRPVDPRERLRSGGHFFDEGADVKPSTDLGYATSVCHSPTLGHDIGLGFLVNGRARLGDRVRLVDRLRGGEVLCEVVQTPFVDPEGGRLRG
ncbi:MAG: sarcosine oxidase subunit alpha family protein [Pseudomonadota bacterium]